MSTFGAIQKAAGCGAGSRSGCPYYSTAPIPGVPIRAGLGTAKPRGPHHDPMPNIGLPHADSSYLLLLEVQELHWAQLPVAVPAGSPLPAPAAAPAPIGLVAEAADPVLAGGSGADRLRGGFHHHDVLEGPEERGEGEKTARPPHQHPHLQHQDVRTYRGFRNAKISHFEARETAKLQTFIMAGGAHTT